MLPPRLLGLGSVERTELQHGEALDVGLGLPFFNCVVLRKTPVAMVLALLIHARSHHLVFERELILRRVSLDLLGYPQHRVLLHVDEL